MLLKIKETGKIYKVELRVWHNGDNAGYGPDQSEGIMTNLCWTTRERDEYGAYVLPQYDYDDIIKYWQDEVARANAAPYKYSGTNEDGQLTGLPGTRYNRDQTNETRKLIISPDEWCLDVTEITPEQEAQIHMKAILTAVKKYKAAAEHLDAQLVSWLASYFSATNFDYANSNDCEDLIKKGRELLKSDISPEVKEILAQRIEVWGHEKNN